MNSELSDKLTSIEGKELIYKRNSPSDSEISKVELNLNLKFSNELKLFLKELSFKKFLDFPFFVSIDKKLPNHLNLELKTIEAWSIGVPKGCVVLCNPNGNYICFTPDETVAFWEHEVEEFSMEWDGIDEWLVELYEEIHG